MIDGLLPIRGQDVTRISLKTLVDLEQKGRSQHEAHQKEEILSALTLAHVPVYSSATGAYP